MNSYFSWQHAIRAAKLEPPTKLILYTIATRMAADGSGCFPSYNTMAADSGMSRRSVITHVEKAVLAGLLKVINRRDEAELNKSNVYQIVMPKGSAGGALGVVQEVHYGGAGGALGGGAGGAPITTHLSNYPINNNPLTPQGGTERFSDFWLSWPVSERKTDKKQCQDKWRAYKLDAIADDVIIALEAWKASKDWRKNSGAFIPAPKVWLNGRRWETPPQIKVTQEYNKEDLPF